MADVLSETLSQQAKSLLAYCYEHSVQLAAPVLLRYEVTAAVRKNVYRKLITAADAEIARLILKRLTQPFQFIVDDNLLDRAYEIATELERPTAYDSQYLALAERLGCAFWTADEKLYNSTNKSFEIKWLKQWIVPDN